MTTHTLVSNINKYLNSYFSLHFHIFKVSSNKTCLLFSFFIIFFFSFFFLFVKEQLVKGRLVQLFGGMFFLQCMLFNEKLFSNKNMCSSF